MVWEHGQSVCSQKLSVAESISILPPPPRPFRLSVLPMLIQNAAQAQQAHLTRCCLASCDADGVVASRNSVLSSVHKLLLHPTSSGSKRAVHDV